MPSADFDAIEKQMLLIFANLPISFGDSLPPKLRLRYFILIKDISNFAKRIKKFQAILAAKNYQEPDWFRRSSHQQIISLPDFHAINDAFQKIQHSLHHEYVDELTEEYQMQYYRLLERHAYLQAKTLRFKDELQRKGLL